jgi:glutamine synthetase
MSRQPHPAQRRTMPTDFRNFLTLSYEELEELNLAAKADRAAHADPDAIREKRLKYLADEKRIKAVTVLFSDLEGRLHLLDYDKKYLLHSYENLTFDGSSIRGFTEQAESDLRLGIDWSAFYWVPGDVFGSGKVLVFGNVIDKDGSPYSGDLRGVLKHYCDRLYKEKNYTLNAATEIEGFLFAGLDAEQRFPVTGKFDYVSGGGYFHSLPLDPLRQFIDSAAEVQRAMGFQNEKDHPEVAPSQFEINFGYAEAVTAADQIQLYKLLCRQIANNRGMTACFLPKPVMGVNGSGMHTNVSVMQGKTNLFWDAQGDEKLSQFGWDFLDRVLTRALDLCLIFNSSVNAYRRLDPRFEAPNEIRASATDRGAMIRIPIGNERSARAEVRAVAPDANPYLAIYSIFRTGIDGEISKDPNLRAGGRFLPHQIQQAIADFESSGWIASILGDDVQGRYVDLKQASADRSPRDLGTIVKPSEVQFHHAVYNQELWNDF